MRATSTFPIPYCPRSRSVSPVDRTGRHPIPHRNALQPADPPLARGPPRTAPTANDTAPARQASPKTEAPDKMGALRAREVHQLPAVRQEGLGRRAPGVGPALGMERQEQGRRDTVAARGARQRRCVSPFGDDDVTEMAYRCGL